MLALLLQESTREATGPMTDGIRCTCRAPINPQGAHIDERGELTYDSRNTRLIHRLIYQAHRIRIVKPEWCRGDIIPHIHLPGGGVYIFFAEAARNLRRKWHVP